MVGIFLPKKVCYLDAEAKMAMAVGRVMPDQAWWLPRGEPDQSGQLGQSAQPKCGGDEDDSNEQALLCLVMERHGSQQDSEGASNEGQGEEYPFRNSPAGFPCLMLVEAHQRESQQTGEGEPA